MAYTVVSNAIVDRTFHGGLGVAFHEEFTKRDGTTGKMYFSGFSEQPHGLSEGDRGTFKGVLSVKAREYEKDGEIRTSVDVTLNNLKFEPAESSEGPF